MMADFESLSPDGDNYVRKLSERGPHALYQ